MKIAMLCLRGAPLTEETEIIDVKRAIEDYAWYFFKSTQGACARTFLRRRDFVIDVPLNFFHTEDVRQHLRPRQIKNKQTGQQAKFGAGERVCDLKTEFRNNTTTDQTYKFRFERTRKAALSVTFQKGFTLGGKAHFTLGLPLAGSSKSGADMSMSLQVTKSEGEVFEDTLVLETTSDISVEKKHSYVTGVSMNQVNVSYEFTLETILTMPQNKAPVTISRKKGGDVISSFYIKNLKDVFARFSHVNFTAEPSSVKIITSGIVEGVQLSDQQIILDSRKIESEDKSTSTVDMASQHPQTQPLPQPIHSTTSTVVRPSDLGSLTPTVIKEEPEEKAESEENQASAKPTDRLRDPQTATERRTSFKRLNQFEENYTSLTAGSPETKILQTPVIPTIVKTSPTTPRLASPEAKSLDDDYKKHRLREVTPKRGSRPKSPLLVNEPSSFHGTSPMTQRPKLSKMTSV